MPAATASKWVPLPRDYDAERAKTAVEMAPTATDPLRRGFAATVPTVSSGGAGAGASATSTPAKDPLSPAPAAAADPLSDPLSSPVVSDPLSGGGGFVDPLSALGASPAIVDPLSGAGAPAAATPAVAVASPAVKLVTREDDGDVMVSSKFVSWSRRKQEIVSKFTTASQLSVPSFVSADLQKQAGKAQTTTKARLDHLDDEKDLQTTVLQYSQKEYIQHMEELNDELAKAWNREERVKALKMAIQCAKLLGDSTVPHFYPSMFVLITEILDTFGKLVFERIKNKGLANAAAKNKKAHEFVPSDVTEEARETCRNWFFKIASIRELLPRLYVEMSIMRCYQFLGDRDEFLKIFPRMCSMIRGIGDPLVATYARCYLSRRGHEIMPDLKTYLNNSFNDFTFSFKDISGPYWTKKISEQYQMTAVTYTDLLGPGLGWLLQCVAADQGQDVFKMVLSNYASTCNGNAMILHQILLNFDSAHVSQYAAHITPLIRESEAGTISKHTLYAALGRCLIETPPPKAQQLPLLNEVWKHVTKIEDPEEYLQVAVVYIEYVMAYFTDKEINVLLRDLNRHVAPNRAYVNLQAPLEALALALVRHVEDFARLLAMEQFMTFLDLFVDRSKVQVCKALLEVFASSKDSTTDPVLIHAAFDMAKTLHDSVDSLSFVDEVRQISKLICNFVRKIHFANDLEQHLNFFVDCRRFFVNLDAVKDTLVMGVCGLVQRAHAIVNGNHTKRTISFVKACLAYCHITIPSIEDRLLRLHLFLHCGQISLVNNTLAQADTFFKTAITLIPDLPTLGTTPPEDRLVSFLLSFASTLVVVPGHPDVGPFYLIKGLLNVVKDYPFDPKSGARATVYLGMIGLFCTLAQPKLPYRVNDNAKETGGASIDSNDVLYACEDGYMEELQALLDKLLEEVLQSLAESKDPIAALQLLNRLISSAKLTSSSAVLAYDLCSLAKKGTKGKDDAVFMKNSLRSLGKLAQTQGRLYQELLRKLQSVADAAA